MKQARRALILCLFILCCGGSGNCADIFFPPLQPLSGGGLLGANTPQIMQNQFSNHVYGPKTIVTYPKISEIETSLYGNTYANQDVLLRLARIEKSIFSTTYPRLTLAQRVDNIVMNYNQINQYPNISTTGLSQIESKVFGRNYSQNNPQIRIEQLEQKLLGAVQDGDLTQRYETINVAASSYNNNQIASNYYQNPLATNQTGWKGLLSTLGSAFLGGGMMTGFTPSMDPFYNTPTTCGYNGNNYANLGGNLAGNPGSGIYQGYRSNRGYSDQYKDYGTGSRVTILD